MAADSGMDTCPSPEIADSRKRPRDGDTENGDIKRSHFSSVQDLVTALPVANGHGNNIAPHFGGEGTFHFKLLVPSMAAGAIIGKGGETIAQLQKETGARVKMSKSHDFYPGTSERVCMITGSVDAIMAVLDFIMDKIKEKPDFAKPFLIEPEGKAPMEREKQVKILVPNSTAGMIIGKGGNFIKLIKEASGSYVQISQKATDITLQERCITVLGEKEANKKACMMILSKVVDDPQSGSCPNISYGDVAGPVANYNPKGSPYTYNQQAHGFGAAGGPVLAVNGVGGAVSSAAAAAALGAFNLTLNMAAPNAAATPVSQQIIETIKVSLRNAGYSETACTEICTALSMLSKNGVLGLGLSPAIPALPPASLSAAYFPLSADQPAVYGPIGQVSLGFAAGSTSPSARGSLERFADAAFEAAFRPPAVAPISLGGGAFGLGVGAAAGGGAGAAATLLPLSKSPTPGEVGGVKDSKNVEIAEVIVGAILGPGGRSLIEIQHMSGANIQISKKGTFAPGTRNRIVTITGSPTAISSAQYLIEQKINEEELKRTRHNAISGLMQ